MKKIVIAALFAALALGACTKSGSISDEIAKQEKADAVADAQVQKDNEAFLAQNKAKPGVITTKSGLQYQITRKGDQSMPAPAMGDSVAVMYEGKLINGKIFDSSYERREPAQFQVGGVIPGWNEALQLMHPGDMFELVIPPEIGYAHEDKGDIPPDSVLIFKVELIAYKRASDGKVFQAK